MAHHQLYKGIMTTVSSYRRVLERLYTMVGKEFGLIVISINQETTGSYAAARELLLVARSMSNEVVQAAGVRQVIRGPVIRLDVNTDSEPGVIKSEEIRGAFGGRKFPDGTPILIAFVGNGGDDLKKLVEGKCEEKSDLASIVTGGYLVLTYGGETPKKPSINLCEKPPVAAPPVKRTSTKPVISKPKFCFGVENIDSTRNITYALRVQYCPPTEAPPTPAPAPAPPQSEVSRPIITPVAPVRAIRDARWKQSTAALLTTAAPQPPQPPKIAVVIPTAVGGREWETLVHSVVERELSKVFPLKQEQFVLDLGDGLTARIWPDMVQRISQAKDWTSVFTHQSFNPTPRENYEAFETLGDKVLSLALVHYLFSDSSIQKTLDSNGLTDSHKEILSSVRQAAMAVTMGLNQSRLIRTTVSIDDDMLEDIYEAFFGCLFTVVNREVQAANQGLPICELLFRKILEESFPELDPWSVPKDPQTTLDQVFIRLGWGHPILFYNEETRVTTIKLTRDAFSYLESIGPPLKFDKPLAVGPRSSDKPSSARAAAVIGLTALKMGWGIDTRYASIIVRERLMKDERYATAQREALKVAEEMGFVDIYVARRAKNHNQLYAVIGVKPNDSEVQLHIYKYDNSTANQAAGDDESSSVGLSTRIAAYITALKGFTKNMRR